MKNKKGQGLQISTIILIILGVALLVVLILGFTLGWGQFFPWLSSNNIDTVKTQCQVACTTNSQYGWCNQLRTLNDGDKNVEGAIDVTCEFLGNEFADLGFSPCPTITCPVTE